MLAAPMDTLAVTSGLVLPVVAAALLRPFWWPPLRNEINCIVQDGIDFRASLPSRFAHARSYWRGAKDDRRLTAAFLVLSLLGVGWLAWTGLLGRLDAIPKGLVLLTLAITGGTVLSALMTVGFAYEAIAWVWKGFSDDETLPVENPTNRVGIASPLGEAGFPTVRDVHNALLGDSDDFTPPKFRE